MVKRIVSSVLVFILTLGNVSVFVMNGLAWSNGGYTSDPSIQVKYGTHDWIAQHALDLLPKEEKQYILDNLGYYFYGTELPDNGKATDGIGDTANHHIYFNSKGEVTDDVGALRAQIEFNSTLAKLKSGDNKNAAKNAGTMSHYIADMAVFGHVMGARTQWGAETHHDDYENYVNDHSSLFDMFLVFDGNLSEISAHDAAKDLAYDTTFDGQGRGLTAVWMDRNCNWSNPTFQKRAGESLNLAVNYITDVLHTLYMENKTEAPPPPQQPPEPSPPPLTIPLWTLGAAIVAVALIVILVSSHSRPKQRKGKLVRFF